MPIVAVGVIVLMLIGGVYASGSETAAAPAPLITVEVGKEVSPVRSGLPVRRIEPVVEEISIPKETPKVSAPKPVVQKVVVPVIPPPPPVPAPPVLPPTNPAVDACLARFVGTPCSFTAPDGAQKDGTCMTPAFSPVTCVPYN